MPSPGTLAALTLFVTITVIAGLWLHATAPAALRPVLTTTALILALAGYLALALAVSRA
jgi:hypothetical protein